MIVPLLLAASVALAPTPAPPLASGMPVTMALGSGTLYATPDTGAELTGLTLVVSAGTARELALKNGVAALAAESLLLGQVGGKPLTERVAADGGSIDVVVGPSAVRFTIESLPSAMAAVSADIAHALANPDISVETVDAARAVLTSEIADGERNPTAVGMAMVRSSYYAGASSRPLLGTPESIAQLTSDDVSAFVAAHYVRGNAFAAATGVVDAGTSAGVRAVLAALPAGSEAPPAIAVRPIATDGRRIVTHRDIGVPFVLLGFAAPSLGDPDFAPMLVLRAMLGDIADRSDVTTGAPISRGLDIVYSYDVKPATFDIAINGALLDPSAGLTIVEAIAHNALTKPFNDDVVRRYKNTARGQWALEALTLDDRAWQIGAAVTEGADPGTAANVIAAIDRVTPADVQRVAKRYLQNSIVALVLPRDDEHP
jgi:predicted Zn-dependent peptidase